MINEAYSTATIANGASLSDAVNLQGGRLVAIVMPAAWTAGDLTFQASADGTTFNNVYDEDDAEVVVEAAASRHIILNPGVWLGIRQIKVRSGTSGAAVNQGGARLITLVCVD
jgi:hypothetical protein